MCPLTPLVIALFQTSKTTPDQVGPGETDSLSFSITKLKLFCYSCSHRLDRDYKVLDQLGKGGFGVVFRVEDRVDDGVYALKIIRLPKRCVHVRAACMEVFFCVFVFIVYDVKQCVCVCTLCVCVCVCVQQEGPRASP